jgi:hypothetical protein
MLNTRVAEGVAVGVAEGMVDADAEAEVVVFAVVAVVDAAGDVLLAVWLLLVEDVQPATDNEPTIISTTIANNFFIIRSHLTEKSIKKLKRPSDSLSVLY